jgi:hypothetical protein
MERTSRREDAHRQGDQHFEEPASPVPLAGPNGRAWPAISGRIVKLLIHLRHSGGTAEKIRPECPGPGLMESSERTNNAHPKLDIRDGPDQPPSFSGIP